MRRISPYAKKGSNSKATHAQLRLEGESAGPEPVNEEEWSELHRCLQSMERAVHQLAGADLAGPGSGGTGSGSPGPLEGNQLTLPWPSAPTSSSSPSTPRARGPAAGANAIGPVLSDALPAMRNLDFSSFIPGFRYTPKTLAPHMTRSPGSPNAASSHWRSGGGGEPEYEPEAQAYEESHRILIRNFPPEFCAGMKRDTESFSLCGASWCLRLYPGGFRQETADYLALFLCYGGPPPGLEPDAPYTVSYTVALESEAGAELRRDSFHNSTFTRPGQGRGWDMFLPRASIFSGGAGTGAFRLTVTIRRGGPPPHPHLSLAGLHGRGGVQHHRLTSSSPAGALSVITNASLASALQLPRRDYLSASAAHSQAHIRPSSASAAAAAARSAAAARFVTDSPYFSASRRYADLFARTHHHALVAASASAAATAAASPTSPSAAGAGPGLARAPLPQRPRSAMAMRRHAIGDRGEPKRSFECARTGETVLQDPGQPGPAAVSGAWEANPYPPTAGRRSPRLCRPMSAPPQRHR